MCIIHKMTSFSSGLPSPSIDYPIEFRVQYTNDKEYRATIRTLCNMSSNILAFVKSEEEVDDIDEITRDEWDFDQDAITKLFDFIYSATGTLFDEMYKKAAGFMLSEDPNIGLAVLFSYDYLMDFHPVLCDYFRFIKDKSTFESSMPSMVHLRQRLFR